MTAPVPSHAALELKEVLMLLRRDAWLQALRGYSHGKRPLSDLFDVMDHCPHGWDPKDCDHCEGQR